MHDPDLIFSLGPNCRNTWNLRDYFSLDRAYPFDWWITPAKSMLALLDREAVFQASREDLVVTEPENGSNTVYNRRLNLLHHHDFDRDGPLVRPIADAAIDRLNGKYRALFTRFWNDLDEAERPLAVMNGIFRGWTGRTPDGGQNAALNGPLAPQALVDAVRERLGAKVSVLIIDVGEAQDLALEGGRLLRLPDGGIRQDMPKGQGYAEPVQVFRDAYARAGLHPGSMRLAEEAGNLMISNNTPRVRRG